MYLADLGQAVHHRRFRMLRQHPSTDPCSMFPILYPAQPFLQHEEAHFSSALQWSHPRKLVRGKSHQRELPVQLGVNEVPFLPPFPHAQKDEGYHPPVQKKNAS
ncbi:hypothetical protein H113_03405 [Trichophyton rubrum MR1459]|uniref:Uncharacterized protein n=1 Tax=Trichophyton rubrum (strain ATCC MYA-4607 / CBS 118892) TaxID=559305 RepID=A0A080WHS8_TRIRC|nr:uncharacterized protein TERG_12358 [Trichophyton rubrum CBS 118892]EZF96439.1 hypothetical protein H113_03405 [Trichophyton rubrum MR1459]EZG07457.1 hypothetical protein H106_03237 [Trichophyton rubrum CBS 735.88]KFL62146.1 hypothetical protein TERG_12358 [Trichophyton rubrum CBS 118892]